MFPIYLAQLKDVLHTPIPDSYLVLTDRLWPRGTRKVDMEHIDWYKAASPSTELRQGFHTGTLSTQQFQLAYKKQLRAEPQVLAPLIEKARQQPVYLVTATRDPNTSYLVVLHQAILDAAGDDYLSYGSAQQKNKESV